LKEKTKNHLLSKLPFPLWAACWTFKICREWKKYNQGAIIINMSDTATIDGKLNVNYPDGAKENFYARVKPEVILHYF